MSVRNTRKKTRLLKFVIILASLLLLVGALVIVLEKTKVTNFIKLSNSVTENTGPTKEEAATQKKNEITDKEKFVNTTDQNGQPMSGSNTTPSPTSNLTITATQDASSVTILSKIYNVSSGTCKLVVNNSEKTTSQSAQVIYQPQFSSCAGFSVPVGSLGSGIWSISVTVAPGSGDPMTQSTSLEVK